MFWVVAGDDLSECATRAEAVKLRDHEIQRRRMDGWTVFPSVRLDQGEEIFQAMGNGSLQHIYLTDRVPAAPVNGDS